DRHAVTEDHAALRSERGELLRELARVAGFVGRGIGSADDPVTPRAERRLQSDALLGRLHLARDPVLAYELRGSRRAVEPLTIGIDLQDSTLQVVVGKADARAQLAQGRARVLADRQNLQHVAPRARREAFDQELQAPEPLARIERRTEEQRR